jgi:hypothetical protein
MTETSGNKQHSDSCPPFLTTPALRMTAPTFPDVSQLPEFKMADCKPEVPESLEWNEISTKFQRIPHIFSHVLNTGDAADITRRRPATEIQNGGL